MSELEGVRVLLIDDDERAMSTLGRRLKQAGCEIVGLQSGEAALEFVADRAGECDAAVIDYYLGTYSGTEIVAKLRFAETPCASVMITGDPSLGVSQRAIQSGATELLIKPCKELINAVSKAVSTTKQWRAQLRELAETAPEKEEETNLSTQVIDRLGERVQLSKRQREVLELMVKGYTNRKIAETLEITEHTVKYHVARVLRDLQLSSRRDLFAMLVHDRPLKP